MKKTVEDMVGEQVREKLAARPPEIEPRVMLALAVKQMTDIMDDKYLALQGEIDDVRKEMRLKTHTHWWMALRKWWHKNDDDYWYGV